MKTFFSNGGNARLNILLQFLQIMQSFGTHSLSETSSYINFVLLGPELEGPLVSTKKGGHQNIRACLAVLDSRYQT
jgi:hypothetical protein